MSPIYKIYSEVGKQLNISPIRVRQIYQVYWQILKEYIENLPLKEISELETEPVVQISSIGKLYCSKKWFYKQKRKHERYKHKNDNSAVQQDSCNSRQENQY